MGFKNYRINIITRLFWIAATFLAFSFTIIHTAFSFSALSILIVGILQVFLLFRYLTRISFYLQNFFVSLREDEYVSLFGKFQKQMPFPELEEYANSLRDKLQAVSFEKEHNYQYLKHAIDHINVAVIVFDEKGKTAFINKACSKLIPGYSFHSLDSVKRNSTDLYALISNSQPGKNSMGTIHLNGSVYHISCYASLIKLQNKEIKFVSLQDISQQIEEKETENWYKITRVITHEIMNTISPLTTMTQKIGGLFKNGRRHKMPSEIDQDVIEDTVKGLEMIEERGQNLQDFVQKYRSLSKSPKAEIVSFRIHDVVKQIMSLLHSEISGKDVTVTLDIPDNTQLYADKNFTAQILINLIKNSLEALEKTDHPQISLEIINSDDQICLKVKDNGKGIPPGQLGDVFLPFYSTKEKGSGIGLSVSRQLMNEMGGKISVQSEPDRGSEFCLWFGGKA